MGILDEAIREHLDLKRRQGAAEDEIERLEGEAFGPPARPGEPDFPEQPTGEEQAMAEGAGDMPPPSSEAATAVEPMPSAPPEPPSEEQPFEPSVGEAPSEEMPAEPAAETPAAPASAPEGGDQFFDQQAGELELDIDLELDEEIELEDLDRESSTPEPSAPSETPEAPASSDTAEAPATEPEGEAPIESLDTVEHHFEEAIEDTGEGEVVEGEIADEDEDKGEGDDDKGEGDDEDVLEETPEFLRDAPEDDELWFEQGEPKDFDF